jgi:hypothetical protein
VSDPGIHAYVAAPVAVSVVEFPLQIEALDAVAVTVGDVLTVITRVEVAEHPLASVPVTVYVLVVVGETVTDDPVRDPGIHVYVDAPEAVIVVELPEQSVVLVAVVATVGSGFTVMVRVPVPVHPLAAVPVTV